MRNQRFRVLCVLSPLFAGLRAERAMLFGGRARTNFRLGRRGTARVDDADRGVRRCPRGDHRITASDGARRLRAAGPDGRPARAVALRQGALLVLEEHGRVPRPLRPPGVVRGAGQLHDRGGDAHALARRRRRARLPVRGRPRGRPADHRDHAARSRGRNERCAARDGRVGRRPARRRDPERRRTGDGPRGSVA